MSADKRTRSYRKGTVLSGGDSTAHFYMSFNNMRPPTDSDASILQEEEEEDEQAAAERESERLFQTEVSDLGKRNRTHMKFLQYSDNSLSLKLQEQFGLTTWEPNIDNQDSLGDVIEPRAKQLMDQAISLIKVCEYEEALRLLDKASNLRHSLKLEELRLGLECHVALADWSSALALHREIARINPGERSSAFIYFLAGQTQMDAGLYPEAFLSLQQAVRREPTNLGYQMKVVEALTFMGRYVDCIYQVTTMLEQQPNNADFYVLRARLNEKLGNTPQVYENISAALRLAPEHEGASTFMSAFLSKAARLSRDSVELLLKGRYPEAAAKLTTCIETNPSEPDYHLHRAFARRKLAEYPAAVEDLVTAIHKAGLVKEVTEEAERQLVLTFNEFGLYCFSVGRLDEAAQLLNKAIQREKQSVELYLNRGDIFYFNNQHNLALADYEQAHELAPGKEVSQRCAIVHTDLGRRNLEDKMYEEAAAHFTHALSFCAHAGQLFLYRARCHLMMEHFKSASKDLAAALILRVPDNNSFGALLNRLFPGRSVAEILKTDLAKGVQEELFPSKKKTSRDPSPSPDDVPSRAASPVRCVSRIDEKLLSDKSALHRGIKSALDDNSYILATGPRATRLKVAVFAETTGALDEKGRIAVEKQYAAGWFQFQTPERQAAAQLHIPLKNLSELE